jgi:hypothetical protein
MKPTATVLAAIFASAFAIVRGADPEQEFRSQVAEADRLIVRTGSPGHDAHLTEIVLREVRGREAVAVTVAHLHFAPIRPTRERNESGEMVKWSATKLMEIPHYTLEFSSKGRPCTAVGLIGLVVARSDSMNGGKDTTLAQVAAEYLKKEFGLVAEPEWVQDSETKEFVLFGPKGMVRANREADRMPGATAPRESDRH